MLNDFLLITLCIVPSVLLMWYVYMKDKIEKEPTYLLLILFIGGIASAVISSSIGTTLKVYIPFLNIKYSEMNLVQVLFKSFIFIALLEELSKWIINYICSWKNKNLNYLFDSIVYATFISLGFATFENIIYGFAYKSYGFTPILLRGMISVPSHAVFGVFMGYYFGLSKKYRISNKVRLSRKYLLLSLLFPLILHFIYDILLIKPTKLHYAIFIIYIIIIYVMAYIKIKKISINIKKIPLK